MTKMMKNDEEAVRKAMSMYNFPHLVIPLVLLL